MTTRAYNGWTRLSDADMLRDAADVLQRRRGSWLVRRYLMWAARELEAGA